LFIRSIVAARAALSFVSFQIVVASTESNGPTEAFLTWPTLRDAKPQLANGLSEMRFSRIEKPAPPDV
jgi:hypothetical protein